MSSPVLRYLGTHKAFGKPVLTGVDLEIEEGEMFAIFGPSGTGKSVLLKSTIGLIVPDRGDVEVRGDSVFFGGRSALLAARRRARYVFQHSALFDSLNVYENVETGLPPEQLARMSREEAASAIWRGLELVNLDPPQVMPLLPDELSGGMKKRVGIARAIVGRPSILLWDEPTTGLDPVNTAAVERLIKRLSRELRVTSVLATHGRGGGALDVRPGGNAGRWHPTLPRNPGEFRSSADPVVRAFVDRAAAEAALDEVEMQ